MTNRIPGMPEVVLHNSEFNALDNALKDQPVPWDSVVEAYDSAFVVEQDEEWVTVSISDREARVFVNWLKAPEKNHAQSHELLDAISKLEAAL